MSTEPENPGRLKTLRRRRLGAALGIPALILLIAVLDSAFKLPDWLAMPLMFLFPGILVLFLIFNIQVRRAQKLVAESTNVPAADISRRPIPRLRTSLILAACWFLLDAFIFQQGIVSLILILLCVFWMAPAAVLARKDRLLLRFRAGRAAAYFLAAVAALGVIRINNSLAERRAEIVVTAIRQYHQKYGHYPQQIQEITPEFLPSIPRARYSFMWNDFKYFKSGESPRFYYVAYPPFLRSVYSFESGTWGQID